MIHRSVRDEERETERKSARRRRRLEDSLGIITHRRPRVPDMSLDAAESFFYDDARLTAWSDALGDVLSRARETKSIVIVDDFFPRAVAENLRDDLQRQPTDCWTSRAEDDDDDVAHDFSLCAHARAVSLFTRAACVMARGAAAGAYPSFSCARYATGDGIDPHDDVAVAPIAVGGGNGDDDVGEEGTVEFHARAYAGVLYLVDDAWKSARDGGALVDLANDGDGGTRVETKFNRFVCFQVPRLHRVEAVRARDKVRHSIFGWWYRPATEDEIPSDFYDDEEEEDEEVEEEEEEEEEERGEERDKKNGSKRRRRA